MRTADLTTRYRYTLCILGILALSLAPNNLKAYNYSRSLDMAEQEDDTAYISPVILQIAPYLNNKILKISDSIKFLPKPKTGMLGKYKNTWSIYVNSKKLDISQIRVTSSALELTDSLSRGKNVININIEDSNSLEIEESFTILVAGDKTLTVNVKQLDNTIVKNGEVVLNFENFKGYHLSSSIKDGQAIFHKVPEVRSFVIVESPNCRGSGNLSKSTSCVDIFCYKQNEVKLYKGLNTEGGASNWLALPENKVPCIEWKKDSAPPHL